MSHEPQPIVPFGYAQIMGVPAAVWTPVTPDDTEEN